jgi:hypothetical protein
MLAISDAGHVSDNKKKRPGVILKRVWRELLGDVDSELLYLSSKE